MFKVQTIGGNVFEGEIFAIDPVTKAIALQQQDGGFVVVNSNFIQQIQGDLSKVKAPDINALGLTVQNVEAREDAALKLAQKHLASLNLNVSGKIQALYDKFSLMYPCRWESNSIIVLEEYSIDPPYDQVKILENNEGKGKSKDMFVKKLEIERRKLQIGSD